MLQILVVCTANICRSPAAAALLSYELGQRFGESVRVASAGTEALAGSPACELSTALVGAYPRWTGGSGSLAHPDHVSRQVAAADLAASALVLGLDRTHRAALAHLAPAARQRTFTLRQAAAIAAAVGGQVAAGGLPAGAPPLPGPAADRLRWLVAEVDAGRGLGPPPQGHNPVQGDEALRWHPDDVPDPHVVGYQAHAAAVQLIEEAVRDFTAAVDSILAAPINAAPAPSA